VRRPGYTQNDARNMQLLVTAFGGPAENVIDLANGPEVVGEMSDAPNHPVQLYSLHLAGSA
jgi:hypothetical protein